ncbi:MAG: hypothetical protein WCD18_27975 [Thermosynechococcaceae cyanobacterium]
MIKHFTKKAINKLIENLGYEIKLKNINQEKSDFKKANLLLYNKYFSEESIKLRRFYNVGAGSFRHFAWTNIDKLTDWYKSVQKGDNFVIDHDLSSLEKLPVETGTAEVFYTSHTIEHISDIAAKNLFQEVYRSLKLNGVFRITCPDIDLDYAAYLRNDEDYFSFARSPRKMHNKDLDPLNISNAQAFIWHIAANVSINHRDGCMQPINDEELKQIITSYSKEEALNHICSRVNLDKQVIYPGNHMNWWNVEKITRFLSEVGFAQIYQSAYGQSRCPILRDLNLFDNTRPKLSCYVEAIK